MRMAFNLSPLLTRSITGGFISTYLQHAPETKITPGNVLQPVPYGTGADGGWRNISLKPSPQKRNVLLGLAAGLLIAGLIRKI
jgi:hypothetical protein